MSVNINTLYPTKTGAPTAAWPYGVPRDVSATGADDGTPWAENWQKDFEAWRQWVLHRGGETPNGNPDDTLTSQVVKASGNVYAMQLPLTAQVLTQDLELVDAFQTRAYTTAGDLGGGVWRATGSTVPGSAGTTDFAAGKLYDVNGVEFIWDGRHCTFEAFDGELQNTIDFAASIRVPIYMTGNTLHVYSTALVLPSACWIIGPKKTIQPPFSPTLQFTGAGNALESSATDDILLEGFNLQSLDVGIDFNDVDNFSIREVSVSSLNNGIILTDCTGYMLETTTAVSNTGAPGRGLTVTNSGQGLINRCKFSGNDVGATVTGLGTFDALAFMACEFSGNSDNGIQLSSNLVPVTIINCEFGANTLSDIQSTPGAGAINPNIIGCHVVKSTASSATSTIVMAASGGSIRDTFTTGTRDSDAAIFIGGDSAKIDRVRIEQITGESCKGIEIDGDDTNITDVTFVADTTTVTCVDINVAANRTRIAGVAYEGVTGSGRILDAGASTQFTDAVVHTFNPLDADAASEVDGFFIERAGYVNRVWVHFPGLTSGAPGGNIQLGKSIAPGSLNFTYFLTQAIPTSAAAWTWLTTSSFSNVDLAATDILVASGDNTGSAANTFTLTVEVTPYRAIS